MEEYYNGDLNRYVQDVLVTGEYEASEIPGQEASEVELKSLHVC